MQPHEVSQTAPVRWGILSTADISLKAVAPAIQASSNGRLIAVGSRNPQRAAEVYSFVPDIRIYPDYDSLIQDPEVEAIYNPLPNGLHAPWSIRAMEAGKHVLCEKPMAVTAKEAAKMVEVARANHVLLMEAFMYRFHPQIIWSLEQAHNGLIGTVRLVRSSFSFDIRLKAEGDVRLQPGLAGGALMDTGCYPVNFCRAVYGRPPLVVAARSYAEKPGGVDMATNAVLDFGDGCFGLIDCSFELPERQSAEIIGETGTITIPAPFTSWKSEGLVLITRNGQATEQRFTPVDHYQLEVEHFDNCIRSGQEPTSSLNETLENMATIEAIHQAAGQKWPLV